MITKSKLNYIQCNLNAPKSQRNTFGKYNYRNCEDILQAVKPLLSDCNCHLIISDEVVAVGDRVYVKATSYLVDSDTQETVGQSTGFARESLSKKGMDDSQLTGSTSSYARKYSLNGLFAIDDNKDADSNDFKNQSDNAKPRVPHQEQLTANLSAMESSKSIPMLKTLAREATDYFTKWGQSDAVVSIREKYTEISNQLEEVA